MFRVCCNSYIHKNVANFAINTVTTLSSRWSVNRSHYAGSVKHAYAYTSATCDVTVYKQVQTYCLYWQAQSHQRALNKKLTSMQYKCHLVQNSIRYLPHLDIYPTSGTKMWTRLFCHWYPLCPYYMVLSTKGSYYRGSQFPFCTTTAYVYSRTKVNNTTKKYYMYVYNLYAIYY